MSHHDVEPARLSLHECRVLVIDDNAASRQLLKVVIESLGVKHVEMAVDGLDGLDKVRAFRPDLVLLDVMMPRMDGFEMCRQLRANPDYADLPVLMQTALSSASERVDCFRAGATDMVTKPVNVPELMARVRIHLEKRLLVGDLQKFRERVEQELRTAQAMQLALIAKPDKIDGIAARHNLRINTHFEPSSELGGDLWDLFELDENRVGLFVADFSGHGVTAALNTFRLHTLIEHLPPHRFTPGEWLKSINVALTELLPVGQFATMLYGVVDVANNTFSYASAGAPGPVLGADTVSVLESRGLFLGVVAQATYDTKVVALPPGGFVFLYSDALTESCDGDDGLLRLVTDARAKQPERPLAYVLDRFFEGVARPVPDDLTAVWITRGG